MPPIIPPPHLCGKIRLMRLELALLNTKRKLFGSLSQAERKRYEELMRELAKKY